MCAAALAFSSCQKDEIKGGADSRYVTLAVTAEEGVETKSAGSMFETVEIVEDGMSLFVDASVSVNRMNPFTAVATKGAEVTKENIEEFNVLMTGTNGDTFSAAGIAKPETSGMSHWAIYNDTKKVEWPNHDGSVKYDFLAYYLQSTNSSFATSGAYTGPESTVSAKDMNDFLVAKTYGRTHSESTYHSGEDNVPIHFYHPLAAVKFNVNGAVITKVTINNLKKDGTVAVKDVEYMDNVSFASAIEWSDLSGKVSYSQSFTETNSEMFFIVPQDLADVTLTFDIIKDGATHQFSTKAKNLGTASWDAGYVYNYTVDTNPAGNVGITVVEDTFNATSNIKEHVRVHNDMRSTTFIRAYVLANWCNAKGVIVSNYDGEIGYNEADWTKSGKFYYSNSPVVGFTDSKDLVSRFTFNRNEKPADNLHLEVKIIAQAIEWDSSVSEAKDAAWSSSQE